MSLTKYFSLFLGFIFMLTACSTEKKILHEVNQVDTEDQIEQLKQLHPDWKIKIIKINDEDLKEKPIYRDVVLSKIIQTRNQQETILYKLLSKDSIKRFRVSYIYLDGKKLSKPAIDSLRTEIIRRYNAGTPFAELARQYSMDGNSKNGGDLGWFEENIMVPKFEQAVKNHVQGDIFIVDIPITDWYYVVYKSYPDSKILQYKILQVVVEN